MDLRMIYGRERRYLDLCSLAGVGVRSLIIPEVLEFLLELDNVGLHFLFGLGADLFVDLLFDHCCWLSQINILIIDYFIKEGLGQKRLQSQGQNGCCFERLHQTALGFRWRRLTCYEVGVRKGPL